MRVLKKGTVPALLAVTVAVMSAAGTAALAQSATAASALVTAVHDGDLGALKQLLAAGGDANAAEPDGTTPLLWAIYHLEPEAAQLLLAAGADPNQANDLAITPLLQAARYGDAELIRQLLEAGARLDQPAGNTEPLLLAAARAGSRDAVQVLLEAGMSPDVREPVDEQTALMWATAEGHLAIARQLLEAGANPNLQARVSELKKRKNADFPSGGFAALHWAARDGNSELINLLLEKGADINVRNGDGSTPMMLAIVNDRFDIAAELLRRGADPDDGSLYYVTEMRDATTDWRARDGTVFRADHPNTLSALDLTRLLLEAGANPNKPFALQMHNTSMCCDTKVNATPFYRAAVAADVEGLKLMLAHGADTEWRPLLNANEDGEPVADPAYGKTALMSAITGGKGVGVSGGPNDLRQGPADFREKALRTPLAAVEVLLAAGAEVNVVGPDQETALHIAARALHPDIVQALAAKGAALDAKNKDGWTPAQLVENTPPPKPNPGFYFEAPPAQPDQIIALLKSLQASRESASR